MDFSAFKRKYGLDRLKEKLEVGASKSRPTNLRVESDTALLAPSSITPTMVRLPCSAPTSPRRRRQPPQSPIARALIATFGPTTLRSVLPRRDASLPHHRRYVSSTNSTASSSSTISSQGDLVTPSFASTSKLTSQPPSPSLATAGHTPISKSPLGRSPLDPSFNLNLDAPLLVQKATFSPGLLPVPSPGSQYGGSTYSRSPCLSHFALGPRAPPRPSITSLCPTSDGSHSPSTLSHFEILGGTEPESPVVSTARFTTFRPSRATFMRMGENRPIALDLSAATRKPRRQDAMQSGPPLSPRFARSRVGLARSTPPATPSKSPVSPRGEAMEGVEEGSAWDDVDIPLRRPVNVLQWVLDSFEPVPS